MSRAFTTSDLLQSNSGTGHSVGSVTVSLPNPTTDDNTVIAMVKSSNFAFTSDGWDMLVQDGDSTAASTGTKIFAKSPVSGGENSWTFTNFAGGFPNWAWYVEEWANVRWAGPMLDRGGIANVAAPATISSGTSSGLPSWEYIMAIGCWSLQIGGTTGTFPTAAAMSNSFTSVTQVNSGTGSAILDCNLYVGRYFGTQNEAGPWESTLTLSSSIAGTAGAGVLAVIAAA